MNPQHSTYTGPVNAVCTLLAKALVPLLDHMAEHGHSVELHS